MTQEHNRSKSPHPKPGDGTQDVRQRGTDANWYGPSEEPQEEYIENSPRPAVEEVVQGHDPNLNEGQPTLSGVPNQGSNFGTQDARGDNVGARTPESPRSK